MRPDVQCIIHCHTPSLIPFGVTKVPLRPLYHMSYFIAQGVPVYEIRDAGGMTDTFVRDRTSRRKPWRKCWATSRRSSNAAMAP